MEHTEQLDPYTLTCPEGVIPLGRARLALVEAGRQGRPGLEVLPVRYRNTL